MDPSILLTNILTILAAKGETVDGAAKAAGVPDSIRNLKRAIGRGSKGGMSMPTLDKIAAYLKTTPAALLSPPGGNSGEIPDDPARLRALLIEQRELMDRLIAQTAVKLPQKPAKKKNR